MHTFHRLNKEVGNKILNKFNYTCCKCRSHINLCVHHNQRMSINDPHYNDEDNLIVLCRSCHMKLHRVNGDIIPTNLFRKGVINNPNGRRGNSPKVYCRVNGCCNEQHARGLCKKHYEYRRVHKLPW